jgi:hypothetical protein
MASFDIGARISGLSPENLEAIENLPRDVGALVRAVSQGLDAVRSGSAAGNPASALFGTLTSLARDVQHLPGVEALVGPLEELVAALPTGGLANLAEVKEAVETVLDVFGPVREAALSGGFEAALTGAIERGLEHLGTLNRETGDVGNVLRDLDDFLGLFEALVRWTTRPPAPEAVVPVFSRLLLGLSHDLLAGAATALERALTPLDGLVPDGADVATWHDAVAAQLELWRGIDARVSVAGAIDWRRLSADLAAAHDTLLTVLAARDRLFSDVLARVNRFELRGLGEVSAALAALPPLEPPRLDASLDGLALQLREFALELDNWTDTPEELRAAIREVVDSVIDILNDSPLGQLRILAITFQQSVLQLLESLPFARVADTAERALGRVADSIRVVDPNVLAKPVRDFLADLETKLAELPKDQIRAALAGVWGEVETAITQIQARVEDVRRLLEGAVSHLKEFVERAQPTVQQVAAQVVTVRTEIESFDLREAAQSVIAELRTLRDRVEEIDADQLPAPAVSLLKQGAELLRRIDVTAAVRAPLEAQLAKLDPTSALTEALATLSHAVVQIRLLDPATIAGRLDAPVDQLLSGLSQFGPAQLKAQIDEALKPARDAVRAVDVSTLLAPLTKLYANLSARIDAVLNPDVLFQPLEALFQPVIELIDAVAPERLLGLVANHAPTVAARITPNAGPPSALGSRQGLLKQSLTPSVPVDDELFGFRPGDILMPLIDLHRRITEEFQRLSDGVLDAAGAIVRRDLVAPFEQLQVDGISARVEARLAELQLKFDPIVTAAALADAVIAYHSVRGKIEAAAQGEFAGADRVVSVQVTAALPDLDPGRLVPPIGQRQALASASIEALARVDLGELEAALESTGRDLGTRLGPLLESAELGAGAMRELLRALDPEPVREDINRLFDDVGRRLAGVQPLLEAALDELGKAVEEFLLPVSPANILRLVVRLHEAVREQVTAVGPARFKDDVRLIFDIVKEQIAVLDPAQFVTEINVARERLLAAIDGVVVGLLPDPKPFDELLQRLATLKPSQLLAPLTAELAPVTDLVGTLAPESLFQPILDALAKVRQEIPEIVADIEAALDDVLAAFPEGGASSVSAELAVTSG